MSKKVKFAITSAVIIMCLLLGFLALFKVEVKEKEEDYTELFTFLNIEKLSLNDIKDIEYIRYTEGGDNTKKITEKSDILRIYNQLNDTLVGEETTKACEDNTTVYKLNLNNGKSYTVEIECDWLVSGGKHYKIK